MQSLVSCYACVGAWGVGLVALPLLWPARLNAESRMRARIFALGASADPPGTVFNDDDGNDAQPAARHGPARCRPEAA
ncbi:hypothetical protein SAMN03159363_1364 [Variovorax sp. EL159]|nr:hypothetical protein SAMN03159363_1364 [Variovorax sp. EL159]